MNVFHYMIILLFILKSLLYLEYSSVDSPYIQDPSSRPIPVERNSRASNRANNGTLKRSTSYTRGPSSVKETSLSPEEELGKVKTISLKRSLAVMETSLPTEKEVG